MLATQRASMCLSAHRFLFAIVIALLLSHSTALALGGKKLAKKIIRDSRKSSLSISNPVTGRSFPSAAKPFYNETTQLFTVTGILKKIPFAAPKKHLKLLVNGRDVGTFMLLKPKNRKSKYYGNGRFSVTFGSPVVPAWPIKDILVELIYTKTDHVIARDTVSVIDLRFEQNINPQSSIDARGNGITAQLSDFGVGVTASDDDPSSGLEIPLFDSLPYPSLQEFNDQLQTAAVSIAKRELGDLENCIDFQDLGEDRFKKVLTFPAFAQALAEAVGFKQTYDFLSANAGQCSAFFGGPAACTAGLQSWCVKSNPTADDFRLCVGKVQEFPRDLFIPAISDVDLSFVDSQQSQNGGFLRAQIDFEGFTGLADGYLRDLSVRWKSNSCLSIPAADSSNDIITEPDYSWLFNWTECKNLELRSLHATTRANPSDSPLYSILRSSLDKRDLEVTDARQASFTFSGGTTDTDKGSCGLSFINATVTSILEFFRIPFQSVVQSRWREGAPHSSTARAIDELLEPLTIGTREYPNHLITAQVDTVTVREITGLRVGYTTDVTPLGEDNFKRLNASFFSQGAGDPYDSSQSLDPDDNPFDFSYDVTLGFLDKVLFARGASDELNFQYRPTYGDLAYFGVIPPFSGPVGGGLPGGGIGGGSSSAANNEAPLTGTFLEAVHPAFAEIKLQPIEIHVERVLDPIVFMLTDPILAVADPLDGLKMAYGMNSLRVTFKEPDSSDGGKVGKIWLTLKGGFLDPDFTLSHDSIAGSQTLDPQFGEDSYYFNVETSNFVSCPKFTHDVLVDQTESCERELEQQIFFLLKDELRGRLAGMLSDIPAPQFFAIEGLTEFAVQSSTESKLQLNQRVNNFSTFNIIPQ